MTKKRVLFLGASGKIGPYLTPGLEAEYDLLLTDVKPHPDGLPIETVDVTEYGQVLAAARGVDAIMNFTVVRGDPVQSFRVNVDGAWNVMQAAAELGIRKVIHSGPEHIRGEYQHDFGIDDAPGAPGSGLYGLTKVLSRQICRVWAQACSIDTICFLFCHLGPRPERTVGQDFHSYSVVYEDLHQACRLALELEHVPEHYQELDLLSYTGHGKYSVDKARRVLGFQPAERWEEYFRRPLQPPRSPG